MYSFLNPRLLPYDLGSPEFCAERFLLACMSRTIFRFRKGEKMNDLYRPPSDMCKSLHLFSWNLLPFFLFPFFFLVKGMEKKSI